jgi:hypothetical protein
MNREVHVRIWERLEVRVLRATRQSFALRPTTLGDRYRLDELKFADTAATGGNALKAGTPRHAADVPGLVSKAVVRVLPRDASS